MPVVGSTGLAAWIERRTCDRVFLDLLERLAGEGRHVSDNNRAGNYAPRFFAQQPDREGFNRTDFERAMHDLFKQKKIKRGTWPDPYRRKLPCIPPA